MVSTKSNLPVSDRLAQSLKDLRESAATLNQASDELAKAISPIDAALKKLNLGVTAWHQYTGAAESDGSFWNRSIGYAKIAGKWGLALSTSSGYMHDPEYDHEAWLFNDAPRWMRIEAVEHVPALVEELVKSVKKTASDLQVKTTKARDLAAMIAAVAADGEGRGGV